MLFKKFIPVAMAMALVSGISYEAKSESVFIEATEDNIVRGGDDNRNKVQDVQDIRLRLKEPGSPGTRRKAWLKFDLSGHQLEPDQSVTFHVTFLSSNYGADKGGGVGTLQAWALNAGFTPQAGVLGIDWTADQITFDNAPGNIHDNSPGVLRSAMSQIGRDQLIDLEGEGAVPTGTVFSFPIDRLSHHLQPDGSITIALFISHQTNRDPVFDFHSSRTFVPAYRPRLELD